MTDDSKKKTLSVLKGNFETKKQVEPAQSENPNEENLVEELEKQALASIGGSMVYMERKKRTWDGNA